MAAGYWGRESPEFKATLAGEAGGFLRTGDEGFLHEGELFVCGRRKDLVILRGGGRRVLPPDVRAPRKARAGKNHYPQDVERSCERAAPDTLRPGCVAAFPSSGADGEILVVVAEVRLAHLAVPW